MAFPKLLTIPLAWRQPNSKGRPDNGLRTKDQQTNNVGESSGRVGIVSVQSEFGSGSGSNSALPLGTSDFFWHPDQDNDQDARVGDFRKFIHDTVLTSWRSMEVGPSLNPIIPKQLGFNVTIVDHADQKTVSEKYERQGLDTSKIEPVDIVWTGGKLSEATPERNFRAIVACHMIEHTPDFIGFLQDCTEVLASDGQIFLIVPDRRFCFDFLHCSSDVAKVIQDHRQKRTRHSFESLFRNATNVKAWTGGSATIAWGPHKIDEITFANGDPHIALYSSIKQSEATEYVDSHENYFTPISFVHLIEELRYLGLIELSVSLVSRARGCEFLIILTRAREKSTLSPEAYLELKKWLLLATLREERERFQYLTTLLAE
jgi:hypothetical protein